MFSGFIKLVSLLMVTAVPFAASRAEDRLINIRQVQFSGDDRVDILLDGQIEPSKIRTEFFNDIIQLSVTDASVYPAKISSVSGRDLSKIFVYQYAPRLVRVRLTVKGKAESFQDRVNVRSGGKMLTVRLGKPGTDVVATSSAQAAKPAAKPDAKADSKPASRDIQPDERALLERVLKTPEAKGDKRHAKKKSDQAQAEPLSGGRESLAPWRMLASLAGVVLLLGAALLGLRRLAGGKARNGALGRWVRRSLGKSERLIEVISTHHLGPKKSIHMVRVAGRTLVLGVAEDSINLITELGGSAAGPSATSAQAPAALGGDDDFLSTLGEQLAQESGRPANGAVSVDATAAGPAVYSGARSNTRDRIRSRLEGMKQL